MASTIFSLNGVRLESSEDPLETLIAWTEGVQKRYRVGVLSPGTIRAALVKSIQERHYRLSLSKPEDIGEAWNKGFDLHLEDKGETVMSCFDVFCGEEGGCRFVSARLTRFKTQGRWGWIDPSGKIWFEKWNTVREAAELLKLKALEPQNPIEVDLLRVRLRSPRWLPGPTEVQVGDWTYPAWGSEWDEAEDVKAHRHRWAAFLRRIAKMPKGFWPKVLYEEEVEFPPAPEPRDSRWAKNLEEVLEVERRSPYANLFGVIVNRDLEALETMLEWKAKADEPFSDGRTPLWMALERGWIEGAVLLLSRGANLEAKDDSGLVLYKTVPKRHLGALLERVAEEGSEELQRRVFAIVGHGFLSSL